MVEEIAVGGIIAVVFGRTILAVLAPATARSPTPYLIFGGLQIVLGVTLSGAAYAHGVVWPWPLLLAVVGVYNLWRGDRLRQNPRGTPE
jgi:hypothetical protein